VDQSSTTFNLPIESSVGGVHDPQTNSQW
jgi:hypothetical protein